MAVFLEDTFTDTNGTALTSHTPDDGGTWVEHGVSIGTPTGQIQSNQLAGDFGLFALYYNDETPPSADYRAFLTVDLQSTGDSANGGGLAMRLDTGTPLECYLCRIRSGSIVLESFVAGSSSTLATVTHSFSAEAYVMEFEIIGTAITIYVQRVSNGNYINSSGTEVGSKTAAISTTDSDISAAGVIGIGSRSTFYQFDDLQVETTETEFTESVSSTITFSQDMFQGGQHSAENTMNLNSQIVFFNVVEDRQVPESNLALVQEVILAGLIQGRISNLEFEQEAIGELLGTQTPSSNLGLTQEAVVVFGVPHSAPWGLGAVSQTLELVSDFDNISEREEESILAFTDEAIASYGLDSTLAFVQSVNGGVGEDIEQELGISQTVSRAGSEWVRSLSSTMTITSSGNGWNGNDKCFRRFGESSGPAASGGTLTLFSQDGLYSVVLRNPEIDNSRRTAFDRVLRETRGGNLIVYRDTDWNVVQTLLFTIVALKRSTLDDLQTFFLNTLGEEITLVDWLGEEWSGVVTRPNETVTEDREGYWTLPFEFEGTKQQGSSGAQNLGLSQEASAIVESP